MNLVTLTPYYKVIADAQSRALDGTCYVVRGCAPTANGAGLRVDVAAGDTVEGGTTHFRYAGGNVTCTAAPATPLYRRDIVYRASDGTLTVTAGTAARLTSTTPVPPALPASATLIAVVFIASGQTTLVATDVEDCRQVRKDDSTFNVKVFGATGDAVTDDTAAIQAAIAAANSATGGTVFFPIGIYLCASSLVLDGMNGICLQGVGGMPGGTPASWLIYSGTGTSFISARSTGGIHLKNLYVQYSSTSFTGLLVDTSHSAAATDTNSFLAQDCQFSATSGHSAAALISLDDTIDSTIERCLFSNAAVGIRGVSSGAHYSNAIRVIGCEFSSATGSISTAHIQYPGQGWIISGNTFEMGNAAGTVGAIAIGFGAALGIEISGNWFGDAVGALTIIQAGSGSITGNYIAGSSTSTAISIPSSVNAVMVAGNVFATHSVGVLIASNGTEIVVVGNQFTAVTTAVSGTPLSGQIQNGMGAVLNYMAYKARAYNNNAQSINSGAGTALQLDAESYDPNANFNTGTYLYTVPVAGYYYIDWRAELVSAGGVGFLSYIIKNGVANAARGTYGTLTGTAGSTILSLAAADTIGVGIFQNSGAPVNTQPGAGYCYLDIHYVSS